MKDLHHATQSAARRVGLPDDTQRAHHRLLAAAAGQPADRDPRLARHTRPEFAPAGRALADPPGPGHHVVAAIPVEGAAELRWPAVLDAADGRAFLDPAARPVG